ncbi:uncharacterized protein LOC129938471 isoform X2 [Eupeodes corollae]|uniref:uncharacterized protein LOC129938471 isoform X2 n=1 Tax=Eupeodes corollae TaxID=290404 RepID=UPI002490EDDF|nr:uncharacterized protein LOC129938471 isoform X2 [Eupeodes corollae]XP_055902049.1 uncharacterized protein LOC129938471 isoform X2 [Eupeodes corollae]XP_055902050.1 uncharacterized protein LOC129938471 isoform X2 [Eupeodes corollae]
MADPCTNPEPDDNAAAAAPQALSKVKLEEFDDEIPEPIQVLDEILSEFEEPESLPLIQDQGSPLQGNQSEDDGYMSMNGRRTTKVSTPPEQQKFGPVVESNDSGHCESIENHDHTMENNDSKEGEEELVEEKKPSASSSPVRSCENNNFIATPTDPITVVNEKNGGDNNVETSPVKKITSQEKLPSEPSISQTTLPKARTTACIPSKYSSLPCSGAHKLGDRAISSGSFDGERNALGIDISAVHNAVIRGGVARIPETIVNEHPVTIYPGRASPPRTRVPPRTLASSVEKHREVCRNAQFSNTNDADIFVTNIASNSSPLKRLFATSPLSSVRNGGVGIGGNELANSNFETQRIIITDSLKNFAKLESNIALKSSNNNAFGEKRRLNDSSSDEEFSDDSLEDQSLPPPPAPPTVPPTPSLSAPATPRKRGSISWEINLDEVDDAGNNIFGSKHKSGNKLKKAGSRERQEFTSAAVFKPVIERNSTSISESSVTSTSDNGQEPLEAAQHQVQVCSTEDEATSIYSDAEDILPVFPANMVGKGTFIIRKGRKERQQLPELFAIKSTSMHSNLSPECNSSSTYNNQSLMIPNSRHSIDLGMSSSSSHNHSISREQIGLSPRSRLSLDLGSPTFESPNQHQHFSENRPTFSKTASFEHPSQLLQRPNDYKIEKDTKSAKNGSEGCLNNMESSGNNYSSGFFSLSNSNPNVSSSSIMRQQASSGDLHASTATTPRRELAPPLEEDEEQYSESQSGCAPLRQIENNISALLRGDISVARVGDITQQRRSLGFRPGVHKSESAKEMLLSQNAFGPLPPTPTSSSPELVDSDGLPPLPPSPTDVEDNMDSDHITSGIHDIKLHSKPNHFGKYTPDESTIPQPPAIPPHRSPMPSNTMKARSMDGGYSKKCGKNYGHGSTPGTLPCEMPVCGSTKRNLPGSYSRRTPPTQTTPREENRLQTSCSLPETPIFARGCDIARTPHRRPTEPTVGGGGSVSRTAPRSSTNAQNMNFGSSIVGIGAGNTLTGCRQRTLSQALQTGEMLRLTGGPARGWYPKQRSMRPASTENLDHLHRIQQSSSMRAWDGTAGMSGTGSSRKPLTLPPNLTPTFLNKSPREALRRVTSLLIKKGNTKERESKKNKDAVSPQSGGQHGLDSSKVLAKESTSNFNNNLHKSQKKKGFFKNFWKKSKHYSLDQ